MAGLFGSTRQQYVEALKKKRDAEQKAAQSKALVGGRAASNLQATLAQIKLTTQKYLSKYIDQYLLLTDENEIVKYFDDIIASGYAAIDTETTGLDTMTCDLVGLCLYVPGKKPCYIPTGHVGHVTKLPLAGQVSKEFLKAQLERCVDTKWVLHNSKFDMRVLRHNCGVRIKPYWDTMIAARLMNENESAALKSLHLKYCNSQDEKALTISTLFDGLNFALIPIECAYLYAAGDPIKTWELYEFQKKWLDSEQLSDIRYVFDNVEMPLVEVLADMEDTGIYVNQQYATQLQSKYHELLKQAEDACYECINRYRDQIELYKRLTPNHKLSDPITLGSSTQIAILLYDIFKLQPKVKSRSGNARGTGEEVLRSLDHEFPELLLKYREMSKLITTYVDKLPAVANPDTGRIHPTFKQIGADTGRLASSDPNLQNIPSHNKEIRKMFAASEGCYFVSGDYSQQEVRVLAYLSGDENMRQSYAEGKDIYARIGSLVYNVPYEDCKEFRPDGTVNPEGKQRRTEMKSVVLGLMYSRGVQGIAEQLNITVQRAKEISEAFYNAFPKIKECIDFSQNMAKTQGYVQTIAGRKRRLPDMRLPEYEFKVSDASKLDSFDALDFDSETTDEATIPREKIEYYWSKMSKAYGWAQKQKVRDEAAAEGIEIIDNGGKIADASRQCLNARIQG